MKTIFAIAFLIVLLASGCGYTEKASGDFLTQLNQPADTVSARQLANRVYQSVFKTGYPYPVDYVNGIPTRYIDSAYLDQPIFFFKNGILLYDANTSYLDSADLKVTGDNKKMDKVTYNQKGWGVYNIKNDTIKAIVYINFFGGKIYTNMLQKFQCHFQGILKNKDTILQWHLIPPYPKVNTKFMDNISYLQSLKKPSDFYYKNIPIQDFLNPDKAWINKYKTQQLSVNP